MVYHGAGGSTLARHRNRLAQETSPYLLQHARNPVDWYPWGEEAFQRARAEDRPVLVSIGYSACHWCHVMERESFEDEVTAGLMNRLFVNVKVDREERPDVDQVYQMAAQLLGVPGGWPLTAFCLPDGRPFFVGTYFPPDDRFGRPGFGRVLTAVADAYRNRRAEVEETAARLQKALRQACAGVGRRRGPSTPAPAVDRGRPVEPLVTAAAAIAARADRRHGGFGGKPKFPQATALDVLLQASRRPGGKDCADHALFTLRQMAAGGIYDQLGGGFHRYAVDERWAVPHFEKMLYDNALLAPLYAAAWQLTGDPFFARVVRGTLGYVLRDLAAPDGGFAASQDADSEGVEGRYYVWTRQQVAEALGTDDADFACMAFGVTAEGNFENGTTVLHLAAGPEELGRAFGLRAEAAAERLEAVRLRLLEARYGRVPPARDDKVITAWNALAIRALVLCGAALGDENYVAAALRTLTFIRERLTGPDGRLWRSYRGRPGPVPGFLDDYAYLVDALFHVHQVTLDPAHLEQALVLAEQMLAQFWDDEAAAFRYAAGDAGPALPAAPRDLYDTALPSANAVALLQLARLHALTGEDSFRRKAERAWTALQGEVEEHPYAMATHVVALDRHRRGFLEVRLVGEPGDPELEGWRRRLGGLYLPDLLLTRRPWPAPADGRTLAAWEGLEPRSGRPVAVVCHDFTCSVPLTHWEELSRALRDAAGEGGLSPA
ncbi:MAG: thioredoxin domain-containing protein [Clostridia bacterium]|nr:thioredoxin domain-containing protein [Clostridia bacterium]